MHLQIKAAARFPLEGVDWQRKLLIGGATGLLLELLFVGLTYLASEEAAFGIAPLTTVLNFPAIGYALEVYNGTLHREVETPPDWGDWQLLLRRGLVGFSIGLAYAAISIFIVLLGLSLLVKGGFMLFLGMVLMLLGMLAGVFVIFFLPMALAHYLARRRVEAAFRPGILWDAINAVLSEYMAAYLLSVGSYITAGLIAAVPYLGGFVWPFLCFYLLLVQARLFGQICAKAA